MPQQLPEGVLPSLDFGGWEAGLADTVDRIDKLVGGLDSNPFSRLVLKAAGVLAAVDEAKVLLDALDRALHTHP